MQLVAHADSGLIRVSIDRVSNPIRGVTDREIAFAHTTGSVSG